MSIYIVEAQRLISSIAQKLREFPEIKPPEGSEFWKTAHFKELAPMDTEKVPTAKEKFENLVQLVLID